MKWIKMRRRANWILQIVSHIALDSILLVFYWHLEFVQ